jgi:uncharacterized protein (DUF2141 family)
MRITFKVLLALFAAHIQAHAATVEIHVAGVAQGKGKVNVAVCDRERFLKQCLYAASVPAQLDAAGETVVAVHGVPPGTWAVLAYHDENANGQLDRNFIGIPRENYGFSRDARGRFGPPGFDDAALPVAEPITTASVRLH